jgi:predicted nucleotidyltransferase
MKHGDRERAPHDETSSVKEEFAAYLPHIRRRWLEEQERWAERRDEAWGVARRIAVLLQERFEADRVIAFGSLVRMDRFDDHSDIDLAVSGIPPEQFFKAWSAAAALSPFALDLVDLADCSPALRLVIDQEGVAL